jgi:hypothetical protein
MSDTNENIETTELQKQSDIDSVKSLVSNSFQDIWSDLDPTKVSKYYTLDFMLLENGVVWNNDSIHNYIAKKQANKRKYRRLNRFDFVKSVHNQNTIWIAYNNYAAFVQEKDTLGTAHWLESVVAIKENDKWKLQQLHSTIVRK